MAGHRLTEGKCIKRSLASGGTPFTKIQKKSVETHIIRSFESDFYEQELSVAVLGWIRPEKSFSSLEDLIQAIHADIHGAEEKLELAENKDLQSHDFFSPLSPQYSQDGVYSG